MRAGVLIAALLFSSLVFTACADQMTEVPNFRRVPTSEERSYVIGPDDLLQIVVWKNESLSRELRVRPDGKITLPLINDIQASGKTPSDLRDIISTRLEKFVEVAGVTVIVKEINSSKVSVLGQVRKPGIYPLRSDLTVLDAIAMAEGFNEFAAPDRMVIIRKNGKETHWIKVNYSEILQGKISEDRLFLASGDTLVVP
ncbi:MAG: polysaccharide biosynthesis/export family protein [Candidatus Manganitrophus sp.]|nr:polysaccharide biosynthesis/export family protein [Candidatus Manganitrophus sp.]MDC4227914.1 polysaccharide biosynthesis/export family protein [Candidatus Manganitrophus sp.]WDT70993.1 MAG: polysaccharide biosynthesis/export family protein [Candidatus Manganitrophus sp.]WDT81731.1 MAG: polysaccharide biosynthesis/export family protein [Candidatus Manganitrophus sp.]